MVVREKQHIAHMPAGDHSTKILASITIRIIMEAAIGETVVDFMDDLSQFTEVGLARCESR